MRFLINRAYVALASTFLLIAALSGCLDYVETGEEEWQPEYGVNYTVYVTDVIDGDTFNAEFPNGSIGTVRLLGIDTPEETTGGNNRNEYDSITDMYCLASWGLAASAFTTEWVEHTDVYIQFDENEGFTDSYDRWLCYTYLQNGTDFNAELLHQGYARAYTQGNCQKESHYMTLQQQAMGNHTGLWSCMPQ